MNGAESFMGSSFDRLGAFPLATFRSLTFDCVEFEIPAR